MKIFLISLLEDSNRRAKIKLQFPFFYKNMEIINAINGKEQSAKDYFYFLSRLYSKNRNLITPSELGCTLSHLDALNNFLNSEDKYSLILEDDILGADINIESIREITNHLPQNSILICGGQEGFDNWKYIVGKKVADGLYELPRFSSKFIYRACCYVVDRDSARYLYKYHSENYGIADHWYNILKGSDVNFFYYNQLCHPLDLTDSRIEPERDFFYKKGFVLLNKSDKRNIFNKLITRLNNDLILFILLLRGYRFVRSKLND